MFRTRISKYFEKKSVDAHPSVSSTTYASTAEIPSEGTNNLGRQKQAPPRFSLSLEGLEWFIYNRSAAYDLLEGYLNKPADSDVSKTEPGESPTETLPRERSFTSSSQESTPKTYKNILESLRPFTDLLTNSDDSFKNEHQNEITRAEYLFLRFLPLQLKLSKGAAIIGNKTTPSLMVYHFQTGRGTIDASQPSNTMDKYKLSYHVDFEKPVVELRPNIHYEQAENPISDFEGWSIISFIVKPIAILRRLLEEFRENRRRQTSAQSEADARSNRARQESWRGLSRYQLSEDNDFELQNFRQRALRDDDNAAGKEYGKFSTILDSPQGSVTFYYDVPGIIPAGVSTVSPKTYSGADIGNKGSAPEWGVDLSFTSSTIHYGPWTDRQRIPLQRMMYPLNFHNFDPAPKRESGELRDYTEFKMYLELKEQTIFRVPMREGSKNSQYASEGSEEEIEEDRDGDKDKDKDEARKLLRPFGWLEIKTSELSTLSYTSSMIPTLIDGWKSILRAELNNIEVRSSVNHELLFAASSHTVDADISTTLKWNELQQWNIKCDSYNVKTFFVREHVMLLSDLVNDFADAPPTSYDLFTPFVYNMNWKIHNSFGIYLNVNDLNIINNPSDFDENTYIAFQGNDLEIDFTVPMDQVYQKKNTISFSIKVRLFILSNLLFVLT